MSTLCARGADVVSPTRSSDVKEFAHKKLPKLIKPNHHEMKVYSAPALPTTRRSRCAQLSRRGVLQNVLLTCSRGDAYFSNGDICV